jgi:hypothetical protein
VELHTTRSPQFLGLRNQHGMWSDSNYGSDVIVDVFDTRIWPKRCSFSDKNLGSVPKRWKGTCESGEKFSVINCNRKLIGARFFIKGHEASGASSGVLPITLMNDTVEYRSPRDTNGHGLIRMLRFQHPDALIPTSACWKESGCFNSDILAAFDSAVRGVNELSRARAWAVRARLVYYWARLELGLESSLISLLELGSIRLKSSSSRKPRARARALR